MTKINFTSLSIFLLVIVLSNCTTAIIDDENTTPISGEVTYEKDVQTIMFNHCTTCHGGTTPFAGLNLESYNTVRAVTENGNLLNRVEDESNPMPPSGLMTEENRIKLAEWAASDFPK